MTLIVGTQIILWKTISFLFNLGGPPNVVIVFIISLFTMILFSYKGVTIINVLNKYLLEDGQSYEFINRMMLKNFYTVHFRRRIYELATILYILSSIEILSGRPLINNDIWNSYSDASLAILLTYLSIDTYINSFMPNVIKKEREQLDKLIGFK